MNRSQKTWELLLEIFWMRETLSVFLIKGIFALLGIEFFPVHPKNLLFYQGHFFFLGNLVPPFVSNQMYDDRRSVLEGQDSRRNNLLAIFSISLSLSPTFHNLLAFFYWAALQIGEQ